ncbi:MAG: lytic transglycosylase domain-containing protein [Solirubrobacteraceae bacterium]
MSSTPRAASASSARRAAAHRRSVRRRRWAVFGLIGAFACVAVVVLAAPLFRKAVNEFLLPLQYQGIIRHQAAAKQLDPALIAAVIYAETKFDPRTSPTGAEGLMQIEPATAEFLAHRSGATRFTVSDLWTPEVNIAYGSYYLRYLLDEYNGNTMLALAAYNGGETNVDRWLAAARAEHRPFEIDDIEFPETRAYVEKVLAAQKDYRSTYPVQLGYG